MLRKKYLLSLEEFSFISKVMYNRASPKSTNQPQQMRLKFKKHMTYS